MYIGYVYNQGIYNTFNHEILKILCKHPRKNQACMHVYSKLPSFCVATSSAITDTLGLDLWTSYSCAMKGGWNGTLLISDPLPGNDSHREAATGRTAPTSPKKDSQGRKCSEWDLQGLRWERKQACEGQEISRGFI